MFKHLVVVGALVLAAGCEKHRPAAPSDPATNQPGAAANPRAADDAQLNAALEALTQAVRKYSVDQRRVPKDFEELVSAGYLSAVPAPPAGKKFVISKDLRVNLASQ